MKQYKNVYGFRVEFLGRGFLGDRWLGVGFIGGRCYSRQCIFLGYNKRDIVRLLKQDLLKLANG